MLVDVSYPYHAYLGSRQKKFPLDWAWENFFQYFCDGRTHFKHAFVSYTSCLVQSVVEKVWLSPEAYFNKNTKKSKIL